MTRSLCLFLWLSGLALSCAKQPDASILPKAETAGLSDKDPWSTAGLSDKDPWSTADLSDMILGEVEGATADSSDIAVATADLQLKNETLSLKHASLYFQRLVDGDLVLLLGDYCAWNPYHQSVVKALVWQNEITISFANLPAGQYRCNLIRYAPGLAVANFENADWLELHRLKPNELIVRDGETGQDIIGLTLESTNNQARLRPYGQTIFAGSSPPETTEETSQGGALTADKFTYPIVGLPGGSDFPCDAGEPRTADPRTWYATVYLGRYQGRWQERGVKSGSHPGVDIRVPSGTMVVNVGHGWVMTSTDHPTWGGLVVVKHWLASGEQVWSVYAHLRRRFVASGQVVAMGQKVGESGGGTTDEHRGFSTGPHLHFQIDRANASFHPFWPTLAVDEMDDGAVAKATHRPIRWLESAVKAVGGGSVVPNTLSQTTSAGRWEGKLIKSADRAEVYLVDNGRKRHVVNEFALLSYGYRDEDIVTVPANDLNSLTRGVDLDVRDYTTFGLAHQLNGATQCRHLFLYFNGEKHEISEWHQKRWPARPETIIWADRPRYQELLSAIPLGAPASDSDLAQR